jgi:hypothetical protein
MKATLAEMEMRGSRVIRRNIQSIPVSDKGVINVTYKCQTIAYAYSDDE